MPSETDSLLQLIAEIYDAALDPGLWGSALAEIGAFTRSSAARLYEEDSRAKTGRILSSWALEPADMDLHDRKIIALNPLTGARHLRGVGKMVSIWDVLRPGELLDPRDCREWMQPLEERDGRCAVLAESGTNVKALALTRHERDGRVDPELRRRVGLMMPHLRRAMEVAAAIDRRKAEAASLADALTGLAAAVFLVDAEGRVSFANEAGRLLLEEGDMLCAVEGRLRACNPRAHQALREALAAAASREAGAAAEGTAIPLIAAQGQDWLAHVLRLGSGARQGAGRARSADAAVFVRQAVFDTRTPLGSVARRYQLSPGELRVLEAVVEIGGVQAITEALGLSEGTVKTHLRHLFEKTHTHRQMDLVRLVAGHASPIAM